MASLPVCGIGNGTPGSTLSTANPPSRDLAPVAFFTPLSSTAFGNETVRWVG
ncbi:hypothetical protein PS685_05205 [Pseudomonas fluorescens]|uniref:Uncharacterized protein n=1 Tax=Pseudomonas fluorescens TaxID=294 RepID=A0A5E7ADN6_PSEFL|nr:hypothetical protein PS685_05205 [Pseudomonas fluorescens]